MSSLSSSDSYHDIDKSVVDREVHREELNLISNGNTQKKLRRKHSSIISSNKVITSDDSETLNHQQKRRQFKVVKQQHIDEPYSLRFSIYEKFLVMYEECHNASSSANLIQYVIHPLVRPDVIRLQRAWAASVAPSCGSEAQSQVQILKPVQITESIGLDYMIADTESIFQNFPNHLFQFFNMKLTKTASYVKMVVSFVACLEGLPVSSLREGESSNGVASVSSSGNASSSVPANDFPHEIRIEQLLSEQVTEMPPELEDDQEDDPIKNIGDWVEPINPQLQPRMRLAGYNTIFFENDSRISQIWSDYTTVMY